MTQQDNSAYNSTKHVNDNLPSMYKESWEQLKTEHSVFNRSNIWCALCSTKSKKEKEKKQNIRNFHIYCFVSLKSNLIKIIIT